MPELHFSDGPSNDKHLAKSDDIEVAFLNGPTTRLYGGRLARLVGEGPAREVVRLPGGTTLMSARELRDSPGTQELIQFERDLEPIPDMYFEPEQIRTVSQRSAVAYLEDAKNSGLSGDRIYIEHYQAQMLIRQQQEAVKYCRLFDTIQDDGHELWLRLEAGPGASPALRGRIIMARFALLEVEYWPETVDLIPKLRDRDTGRLAHIPEQLILPKQWLYTET